MTFPSLSTCRPLRKITWAMAFVMICTSGVHGQAAPLSIQVTQSANSTPLRALEKVEFDVTLSGGKAPYINPFDADEVTVDAILSGPGGKKVQIPGFWMEPYELADLGEGKSHIQPKTTAIAGWRVRLRPTVPGQWNLIVKARDASGEVTSRPLKLQVAAKSKKQHGFVQRATGAGRTRYFQFNDGAPYFPIGENVGWSWKEGLTEYEPWFNGLSQAKANFARLWMAFSPLESKATGLRRYDQKNAAYFDEILSLAEKRGLTCMLAFGTYGEFTTGGAFNEGKWAENPYNALNGGPVPTDKPDDFFTDATARKAYLNRLRYLVARYGAFTSVGFWELWNEKDAAPPWVAEMATYLKKTDPYRRPVTNSYPTTGPAAVWNLPDIDLSQTHRYGDEGSIRDIATGIPSDARNHDAYGKPHLMGEFGISWRGEDAKFDPKGIATNLHNGLWSSAFSGNAGSAMIWWWDNYVHPKSLYSNFTPLAEFAKKVDWPRRSFEPIYLSTSTQKVEAEKFTDLRLEADAGWGAKSIAPVSIGTDGTIHGPGTLLTYLYNVNGTSPDRKEIQGPQEFSVEMKRAGAMRVNIGTVSNFAEMRITVDGTVAANFKFDASPSGVGTYQETKQFPEYNGIYQARFDATREIPLSAGKHRIAIENIDGDWIKINWYEFTNLRSSRFTTLRTNALQDKTSGETLVWLQDVNSNWQSDRDGKTPLQWQGVKLDVPMARPGSYKVEWWDTRLGKSVDKLKTVKVKASPISLPVPTFTRDIALRIAPVH